MSESRINKLLSSCWSSLTPDQRSVYENLTKDRRYNEDTRGSREHDRRPSKKNGGIPREHNNLDVLMKAEGSILQ